MAELNLKQIIDRLNAEFTGETRKLVFWYDDKAEFAEDMETVELQNAKIYHLQPDNQFYTKYFLERVDKTTNYLIYAPFPKPDVRDNHLEDTMLYSRRFFADRASLLSVDLGIEEKYKPVIEKHIKFFANKERTQRFYDLEIENFNEENILVGLLSAVCKARTCSFEEVVRIVLTDGELVDNAFLQEFEKYDLLSAFWQLCEQHFGYTDTKPSLERLLVTLFVTYTGRYVQAELPAAWKSFVSYKSGNIIAFLDSLMNSVLYRDKYDALSTHVAKGLNVLSAFAGMRVDDLVECDTFLAVDQVLVKWLIGRLVSEDIGAIVNGFTIPELCEKRAKMHFGRKTGKTYQMLSSAYSMVKEADYHAADGLKPIIDRYLAADYNIISSIGNSTIITTSWRARKALSRFGNWWKISTRTNIWLACSLRGMLESSRMPHFLQFRCSGSFTMPTCAIPKNVPWSSFRMPCVTRSDRSCLPECRMTRNARQNFLYR